MVVLRVLSGAAEAIADPAFMLVTAMWYTRGEQPTRISIWYAANGIGVAGGGLIGVRSLSLDRSAKSSDRLCSMVSVTSKAVLPAGDTSVRRPSGY